LKNTELLMQITNAIQKIYGIEAAINFIEGPAVELMQTTGENALYLNRLHLDLYLGSIQSLLDNGNLEKGRQVFTKARYLFSDALDLHLQGVELALADGDWAEAERLLLQKEYPPEMKEKREILAARISTLKGREGKIIINFEPDSSQIPVTTTINNMLEHDFLIDTGATFVTIPYSTVEALGLEDELSYHQQEVQTAGGIVSAGSVILSSIELQGWFVSNVKALVIDIPDNPGLGLLGLNFLDRFRLDLQTDKGILLLEPQ